MRLRILLLSGPLLLLTVTSWAQERVRNVRMRALDSAQLEIRYDLINARPGDSVYFGIRSRLRGGLRIRPEFVRGDIGKRLTAGSDRRIVWNALANGYPLNEEIRVTIFVKTGLSSVPTGPTVADRPAQPAPPDLTQPRPAPPEPVVPAPGRVDDPAVQPSPPTAAPVEVASARRRYRGPAWALASVVAPGIGNIFVQSPRPKVGARPLITVACYGLAVYGFSERQKARDAYALYGEQKNRSAAEPYYETANAHHHRYYLATRGAVAVAAIDVILTLAKGLRNGQAARSARPLSGVTLRPGLLAGQPVAVVRYSLP